MGVGRLRGAGDSLTWKVLKVSKLSEYWNFKSYGVFNYDFLKSDVQCMFVTSIDYLLLFILHVYAHFMFSKPSKDQSPTFEKVWNTDVTTKSIIMIIIFAK